MARRVLLAAAVALAAAAVIALPAFAARPGGSPSGPIVVELDPGHGGSETGAVYTYPGTTTTLYEKDINLAVAQATKTKLENLGFTVYLTRDTDRDMSLTARVNKASSDGAQVMISIHHNGNNDPSVNYTTTYYTQKSDERLASLAQKHLVSQLGFQNNGIQRNGFVLTVRPKMPSALTEAWFVTNTDMAVRYQKDPGSLNGPESQALVDAISEYFSK